MTFTTLTLRPKQLMAVWRLPQQGGSEESSFISRTARRLRVFLTQKPPRYETYPHCGSSFGGRFCRSPAWIGWTRMTFRGSSEYRPASLPGTSRCRYLPEAPTKSTKGALVHEQRFSIDAKVAARWPRAGRKVAPRWPVPTTGQPAMHARRSIRKIFARMGFSLARRAPSLASMSQIETQAESCRRRCGQGPKAVPAVSLAREKP